MKFCPECKSMMLPKDGTFKCRKCNYIENSTNADVEEIVFSKTEQDIREVTILEGDTDVGLPTTTIRCEKCENNNAYWWLNQTRSADESETRFFKCTKCNFIWREYD